MTTTDPLTEPPFACIGCGAIVYKILYLMASVYALIKYFIIFMSYLVLIFITFVDWLVDLNVGNFY